VITTAKVYHWRAVDEKKEYLPDHPYYGGMGYGGDERPIFLISIWLLKR